MSTTVDQRVVKMQFDNAQFEKNTAQTMSTLDKLKQKLHLDGASKGLNDVGAAAKNVNMEGLGGAVQTVSAKFSSLQVMAVTALANITNSAVNAGKRLLHSLTIEPVSGGFKEYEMTLNAVQTTMAATGLTAKEVEKELKKLDEYADKTVYGTADMLNNLPKFTNAGVELKDATEAMIGIANATALAGGDASKASIAFYNLGQAIGTGYLTRMDYNSINNAGIATMEWKEQMVDAAIAAGKLKKVGNDLYEAGGKTFTLQQLFIDGLQTQWATTDVMMKVFRDYGSEETKIGEKAYAAAQDIKTFTMMMDSLKATAETGWKDTWQIVVGDLEGAKKLWTGLANFISGILTKAAEVRNFILDVVLNFASPWQKIIDKLEAAGLGKIKKISETIKDAIGTVEYFQDIVNRVWRGDFNNWGDNPDRRDLLKQAGYDQRVVQYLVNMGYGYKITAKDVEEAHKKFGLAVEKTTEETVDMTEALGNLTDAQLKKAGLTEQEIRLYRELERESDRTGKSIAEIAEELSKMNGRTLLIEAFKNAGKGLVSVFNAMRDAWGEIFPPISILTLYNMIKGINTFSKKLVVGTETADKLKRTFKGVFALFKIVGTIVGGPVRIAFNLLCKILKAFDMDILDLTAKIGDAIVKFSDWLDSTLNITAAVEFLVPIIKSAGNAISKWFNAFKQSKAFKSFMAMIDRARDSISAWFDGLAEAENIPKYIFDGLIGGLRAGITRIADAALNIGKTILETVKNYLGIHSPSRKFAEVGTNIIDGLILGIGNAASKFIDVLKTVAQTGLEAVRKVDFGAVFAGALGVGILTIIYKIIDKFGNPMFQFGEMLGTLSDVIEDVGKAMVKNLRAETFKLRAEAILTLAIAIGVLAGAIALLTLLDVGKMWIAVGVIVVLSGVLVGLSFAVNALGKMNTQGAVKSVGVLLGIAVSLVILASAMRKIAKIDIDRIPSILTTMAYMVAGMMGILLMTSLMTKGAMGNNLAKAGAMMILMSLAMSLMISVIKKASKVKLKDIEQAIGVIAGVELMFASMVAISWLAGNNIAKAGGMMLLMAAAFWLMTKVVKSAARISEDDIKRGLSVIAGIGLIFSGFIAVSRLVGASAIKAGTMLLFVSAAMLIMVAVIKLISLIDENDIKKAVGVIAVLGTFFAGLIAVTTVAGTNAHKAGLMLILMSAALLILTGVLFLIGLMDPRKLVKSLGVIAVLETLFGGLIAVTYLAKNCSKTLIVLVAAVTLLGVLLIAMSFIDPAKIAVAAASMSAVVGMFALLVGVTKSIKKIKPSRVIGTLLTLVGVVALLAGVLILMSLIKNVDSMIPSAIALGILMSCLVGVFAIISTLRTNAMKSLKSIGLLTALLIPLMGLVGVLAVMQFVNNAIENVIALSVFFTVMTALLFPLSIIGKMGTGVFVGIAALAALTAAILLMVGGLGALVAESKNIEKYIDTGIGVFVKLAAGFGEMIAAFTNNVSEASLLEVLAVFAMMPVLTIGMALLLPLMLTIGLLAALIGSIGSDGVMANAQKGLLAIMTLSANIGEMISTFTNNVSKASLLEVLAVFAMMPLLTIGFSLLLPLMLVVGALAAAIGALEGYGLSSVISTGLPLLMMLAENIGAMIAAFTNNVSQASILEVAAIFAMMPLLTTGLGLLIPMMVAVGGLAGTIGWLMQYIPDLQDFINVGMPLLVDLANGLGEIVGAFVGGMVEGLLAGLPAIGTVLSDFMSNAEDFIDGCGAVDADTAAGAGFLAAAIVALTVADLITGVTSFLNGGASLADFGTELSNFMTNAKGFIDGCGAVDEQVVNSMRSIVETILLLTAASVIEGLTSFMTGGSSLETFAAQFPKLGTGLAGFITELGTFTSTELEKVKFGADSVKILAAAANEIPNSGGWVGAIMGENNMDEFAAQFPFLGRGLRSFVDHMSDFTSDDLELVKMGAEAVTVLATAASEIPNSGGWVGAIMGENDLDEFAAQFPFLARGLTSFSDAMEGFTEEDLSVVKMGAEAVKVIASAASEIPNSGGWLGAIMGENDLDEFGAQFPFLGRGLRGFMDNVGKLTDDDKTAIAVGADALKIIANAASEIPNSGGFVAFFTGENDMGAFAAKFPLLGSGLRGFVDAIGESSIDSVKSGVDAFVYLVDWLTYLVGAFSPETVESMADAVKSFGYDAAAGLAYLGEVDSANITAVDDTCKVLEQIGKSVKPYEVNSLAAAFSKLVDALVKMDNVKSDSATNLANAVDTLIGINFKDFGFEVVYDFMSGINTVKKEAQSAFAEMVLSCLSTVRNGSILESFDHLGQDLAKSLADGMTEKETTITGKLTATLNKVRTSIRDTYDFPGKFKSLGKSIASGFADGISENAYLAEAKAAAMASAAYEAARKELDVNSPSKIFRALGTSVPEGFAMGIDKLGGMVTRSSTGMADSAISTVTKTLSRISDIATSDIDTQPTIRPVLDLSDVRAGAGSINGLLNTGSSVGVVANVGQISSMMNGYGQNGTNGDVVSAINKLRKDIGSMDRSTYNINGVTYDDGSNITDAVKTIVRAARIERRS